MAGVFLSGLLQLQQSAELCASPVTGYSGLWVGGASLLYCISYDVRWCIQGLIGPKIDRTMHVILSTPTPIKAGVFSIRTLIK